MGYIVRMPKLGMEMQEGELLEWHVEEGESVEADDLLAEIESEKTVAEVTAREAGTFRTRLLAPGDAAEPGAAIGVVAADDEDVGALLAADDEDAEALLAADDAGSESVAASTTSDETQPAETTAGGGDGSTAGGRVRASPKARKLAAERDVSLDAVDGTGPQGAVVAADVEAAGAQSSTTTASEVAASDVSGRTVLEEHEFGQMRRTIAERLGESYRNAVHVTVDREVDVEELLHAKSVATEALDAEVSISDLLLVALSEALAAHPEFNATYEDGTHTLYEDQNVGVAVDVDAGLVTPVLRNLQDRSLVDVAEARRSLTATALDGEYTQDDLAGGTFTVSNLGVLGVDSFTPVINPPQVAILGVNRVREVPRPADGDGVEFRRRMTLSLSFDHRVVDGADAARFLGTLAETVESPWRVLLERT